MGIFARKVVPAIEIDPQVDPARPWAVLGLVNDWVRHAEAKAGATLVATGVTGTALYNLIHNVKHPPLFLALFSTTAAVFVLLGGACGAAALRPRLWSREEPTSLCTSTTSPARSTVLFRTQRLFGSSCSLTRTS